MTQASEPVGKPTENREWGSSEGDEEYCNCHNEGIAQIVKHREIRAYGKLVGYTGRCMTCGMSVGYYAPLGKDTQP